MPQSSRAVNANPKWTAPAAHLLHIEIKVSNTNSDAALNEIAQRLRTDVSFWTRQLLFQSDPAQEQTPRDGTEYALLMEADTRHTAETLASSVDIASLRQISGGDVTSALVRVFSLEGSATFHDMTPQDADKLPIDIRTHDETIDNDNPPEPEYFGLSPNAYVHL